MNKNFHRRRRDSCRASIARLYAFQFALLSAIPSPFSASQRIGPPAPSRRRRQLRMPFAKVPKSSGSPRPCLQPGFFNFLRHSVFRLPSPARARIAADVPHKIALKTRVHFLRPWKVHGHQQAVGETGSNFSGKREFRFETATLDGYTGSS